MTASPTLARARTIAADFAGEAVLRCERFPTGLRNWVFDVVVASGRGFVVRLSHCDNRTELAGGLFWSDLLSDVGVSVAQVLGHDLNGPQPYVILERLAGTDIGNVIDQLTASQIRSAALAVAEMQRRAASLPQADGFGYALSYQSELRPTWRRVIDDELDRAEQQIAQAGVVDPSLADPVRALVEANDAVLDQISPTAFLHDATTKNVIVSEGRVTGLVDIDQMAFGDPLYAIGLTRMSLLAARRSTTYADVQLEQSAAQGRNVDLIDVYTAVFCLGFLGELGQRFNQERPPAIDHSYREHLESVLATFTTMPGDR